MSIPVPVPLTHHAYVIVGDVPRGHAAVLSFLETALQVTVQGNPDVFIVSEAEFTMEHARAVCARELHKPFGSAQYVVIASEMFMRDAQNALLKTLEEPSLDTHIFIVAPATVSLLPTVRSRCFIVGMGGVDHGENGIDTDAFLGMSHAKRLEAVRDIVESGRAGARGWCDALADRAASHATLRQNISARDAIELCRKHMGDKGASAKLLLEHVALSIPEQIV